MRLLRLTALDPLYLAQFYSARPGLANRPHGEQQRAFAKDAYAGLDAWGAALGPLGYETGEIITNAAPLQRAWAKENGVPRYDALPLDGIAVAQAQAFKPEILWYRQHDEALLRRLRASVPAIRLVLGTVGSALPKPHLFRQVDLVLCFAPESAARLKDEGLRTAFLLHAFDPRVLTRLRLPKVSSQVLFSGQLQRESEFHLGREALLEKLAGEVPLTVHTPQADYYLKPDWKSPLRGRLYDLYHFLRRLKLSDKLLASLPLVRRAAQWPQRPLEPARAKLSASVRPAVYGLQMYQALADARIVLNIHADSSPAYASNLRLFEATGAGACLLTDWRPNLPDLFAPGTEVVAYRAPEEAVEKIRFLLEHEDSRAGIAAAGQARTLRSHTFALRAQELDTLLRKALK